MATLDLVVLRHCQGLCGRLNYASPLDQRTRASAEKSAMGQLQVRDRESIESYPWPSRCGKISYDADFVRAAKEIREGVRK
jgi:hypothetical protein